MNLEEKLRVWAAPPSKTEAEKMENAEHAIKNAITNDKLLASLDISVFSQGSYRSRTNVRHDSDVDICVRLNSTFFPEYPVGKTQGDYGHSDGSILFTDYKGIIELALRNYFGSENVERGNKAFDIKSNTYRVDADVVPTMEYRYYVGDREDDYISGVAFLTDPNPDSRKIINWPEQACRNGIEKHKETNERYKKMVRIFKALRNEMQNNGMQSAENITSFLLESLVWHVPDSNFGSDEYKVDFKNTLLHTYSLTQDESSCKDLCEVNDVQYLFGAHQEWKRSDVHNFIIEAWKYLNF